MLKVIAKSEQKFTVSDFAILILSCDKFYDVWNPLTYSFHRYWADCPFDIYLMSNFKVFEDSLIKNIRVGRDLSWSANLLNALENLPHKYIILWLDDVFLADKVTTLDVIGDLEWFYKNEIEYLRLRNTDVRLFRGNQGYERIKEDAPYRTSIFATVWNKDVLSKILIKEENAWQFELRGSIRSKKYNHFYSVRHSRFKYIHGVQKGVWIRTAVKWIKKNNLMIDFQYRKQSGELEHFFMTISKCKGFLINSLPVQFRGSILKFVQKLYLATGIRNKKYYKNH